MNDPVNHPQHYTEHPSGVECITITEHMNFCIGNAIKYLWRADLKNGLEDLEKAAWYIHREIERRQGELSTQQDSESILPKSGTLQRLSSDDYVCQGWVRDAGGGVIEILIDRDTLNYPTANMHVEIREIP